MADKRPMKFGPPPQPRDPAGQFARMPPDPAEVLAEGGRPDGWAPFIGQSTARTFGNEVPWPPAAAPPAPFKGLATGRK